MGTMRKRTKFMVAALATVGIAGGAVAFAAADLVNPQVNATGQDLTVAATLPPTFPAVTPTCLTACTVSLDAGTGTVDVKNTKVAGGIDPVPFYGFRVNGASTDPHVLAGDPASIIKVPVGTKVTITFSQQAAIADPIDLSFPSLAPGDVDHTSGSATYTVTPSAVGTSVFQPGTNPEAPKQIAMGLVGVLIVTPAGCSDATTLKCAFDGTTATTVYNDEAVVATTDLDPEFAANPAAFDMSYFGQARSASDEARTVYHVINGKSFPDTAVINAMPSDKVLLRYVNAGVSDKSMGLLGLHQDLLARNASKYADPQTFVAPLIGPGETADVAVTIPKAADVAAGQEFALVDQSKQMGHGNGYGFGGALTFISIWKGDRPVPTASITSYDGTTLVGTGIPSVSEAKINGYSIAVNAGAFVTTAVSPAVSPAPISAPVTAHPGDTIWLKVTDTNGKTSDPVSFKVPPAPLAAPTATVSIDSSGNVSGTGTSDSTLTITAAEYFVGATDPGLGSGTALTGTFGTASVTNLAGATPVADGALVSLRVKDSNGTWSGVATATYTAPPAPLATPTVAVNTYDIASTTLTAKVTADPSLAITGHKVIVEPVGVPTPHDQAAFEVTALVSDGSVASGGTITDTAVTAASGDTIYIQVQDNNLPPASSPIVSYLVP
jgi:hypothetical protein